MASIEIKINTSIWDALSVEDKDKITKIAKATSLLDKEGTIVADSSAPVADAQNFLDNFSFCKIGCDAAAAAAVAACTASTAGAGLAACLAVAEVAHQACRDAC